MNVCLFMFSSERSSHPDVATVTQRDGNREGKERGGREERSRRGGRKERVERDDGEREGR